MQDKDSNTPKQQPADTTAANTGNASNPSPEADGSKNTHQLLDKKAEKYLRESGNIEDMPDAQDEQDAEEAADR